ncbi:hypothetical protein [Mycobacterium kubicae]|uniref:hypothetical protein n=1 Tax=Mycobacterium kubicae TaxID=120959 RepID=UPI001041F00D|nr:hypothetical protein [Mycobacterium kubicae]
MRHELRRAGGVGSNVRPWLRLCSQGGKSGIRPPWTHAGSPQRTPDATPDATIDGTPSVTTLAL